MKFEEIREHFDYTVKVESFNGEVIIPMPQWQIEYFEESAQEELDKVHTKTEDIYVPSDSIFVGFFSELMKHKKLDPNKTKLLTHDDNFYIEYPITLSKSEHIKRLKLLLDQRKRNFQNMYRHMVLVMKTSEESRKEFVNWSREEKLERILK